MRGCGGSTITSLAVEDSVLYIRGNNRSNVVHENDKKHKFDYRFFYNENRLSFPKPIIEFLIIV